MMEMKYMFFLQREGVDMNLNPNEFSWSHWEGMNSFTTLYRKNTFQSGTRNTAISSSLTRQASFPTMRSVSIRFL